MPVCARCTGIYVGAVLGALGSRSLRIPGARPRVLLLLAVAPSLATLAYEWTTGQMPSHAVRIAAGIPIGLVVAWLVVAAADNQVN
jgi:uncharacterized membrane protein